ncbi:MAG: neuromedin U [Steroidobacteraceae bacterium]
MDKHRHLAAEASCAAAFLAAMLLATTAHADLSAEDLAKIAQNPVGNLISVPFQENLYLNSGPLEKNYNVLNIQPVIPISVSEDWNIITRTIIPIVSLPAFAPGQTRTNGVGDVQLTAFLSPAKPGAWIWGAGVITQLPTHSNQLLGNDNVGFGPSFVVLHLEHGSPWVYGVLVNNVWSSNNATAPSYNNGLMQPFANYNFESGLYLTSSPIVTVNWQAKGSNQWTVPMGGGVGKLFKIGRLPVNTQLSMYYSVVRPDFAPNWQVRAQVQLMFPK